MSNVKQRYEGLKEGEKKSEDRSNMLKNKLEKVLDIEHRLTELESLYNDLLDKIAAMQEALSRIEEKINFEEEII